MSSQRSYILKLEERPKGEEAEKRGNLSPLEIRNDGRMLDLIHIFGKPVLCTSQPSLHSESVPNTSIYIYCTQKFYFYANYFFPAQITFFYANYANFLPPTFSKENSIRGRHVRQTTSYKESSLDTKIGKVSVERNRTALPGAQDELIVKPNKGIRSAIEIKIDDDTISRRQYVRSGNEFAVVLARYVVTCQYRAALSRIERRCFYLCCWVVRPFS
jgi:hypothetical protein